MNGLHDNSSSQITDVPLRSFYLYGVKRIISTVPSLTELLVDLGVEEELLAITKFCIHPNQVYESKPRIGGTKDLHIDKILTMQPNLIIANKEENEKVQIEALSQHIEVLLTDIHNLDSALEAILQIAERIGRAERGIELVQDIRMRFAALRPGPARRVLYLIWREPYMSVGRDTFIHDMLMHCGWTSVCGDLNRYPIVEPGDFQPELILLSSEPYPFAEKHIKEVQALWPQADVQLVDGEYFSWYGSRMLNAPTYFQQLLSKRMD